MVRVPPSRYAIPAAQSAGRRHEASDETDTDCRCRVHDADVRWSAAGRPRDVRYDHPVRCRIANLDLAVPARPCGTQLPGGTSDDWHDYCPRPGFERQGSLLRGRRGRDAQFDADVARGARCGPRPSQSRADGQHKATSEMIGMKMRLAAIALVVLAHGADAQQRDTSLARRTAGQRFTATMQPGLTPNRDVILEIPELSVDSIGLTVRDVRAHVALDANAMNLVQVTAGVDVGIKQVQLGIVGVFAEAYLYVDLDHVARIGSRVVPTLDRNPETLTQVFKTVDTAVGSLRGALTGQPQTTTPPATTRQP